ncbi:MAG: hypothetical protein R3C56_08905 [Pirellulaceae bacterium]
MAARLDTHQVSAPHTTAPLGGSVADAPTTSHLGFQVHNRYLVTQDEGGMVVVDQHALHERILYEQLRQKVDSHSLESQRLLVPEPLDLTAAEAAAAARLLELLAQIGIEIEPFGGDTVLMTSYPAMLANMRPAEVLRRVLEPLMSGGKEPSARDVLDELLNMLACKAAIKAGDKLSSKRLRPYWNNAITIKIHTIARTAAPPLSSSAANNSIRCSNALEPAMPFARSLASGAGYQTRGGFRRGTHQRLVTSSTTANLTTYRPITGPAAPMAGLLCAANCSKFLWNRLANLVAVA